MWRIQWRLLVVSMATITVPLLHAQKPVVGKPTPPKPAQAPPQSVLQTPGERIPNCPSTVIQWWKESVGRGGRISCADDPTRPVILLVHGLHQDFRSWTEPSSSEYAYDLRHPSGKRIGDTHSVMNAGVYKLAVSEWLYKDDKKGWDLENNWFNFLTKQGFTVATWSQPGKQFHEAVPSALEAFDSLLSHTAARSPNAPPPVVLIGHSRGGLVIRRILKERGSKDRVRQVVTLHSPHRGSELARAPGRIIAETVDLMDCCAPASLTAPLKKELKDLVTEAMRPIGKIVWFDVSSNLERGKQRELLDDESRELMPDGPLLRDLAKDERAIEGVTYHTFGGRDPTLYKIYLWLFDPMSAVPQTKCERQYDPTSCKTYFVWRANPSELPVVSPILDAVRDFVEEVKPGKGDALVTDASARLPWSTHETTGLNHAQVLWDRPLQEKVARLLEPAGGKRVTNASTRAAPPPAPAPPSRTP